MTTGVMRFCPFAASRWIYQNIPAPLNISLTLSDGSTYHKPLPAPDGATIQSDGPYTVQFSSHVTGTLTSFASAFARNPGDPGAGASLHVVLAGDPAGTEVLAQADVPVPPQGADPRGTPVSAPFGPAAAQASGSAGAAPALPQARPAWSCRRSGRTGRAKPPGETLP